MSNSRHYLDKMNVIGNKVKYYRELNNLSYQKLSDKLMLLGIDIHKQALYRIEKGERTICDYEICALAVCFKIQVNDLLCDYYKQLKQ